MAAPGFGRIPVIRIAVLPGGSGHYGVIFMPGTCRRTKNDIGRIAAALEAKLGPCPGEADLINAEEWR